MLVPIFLLAYSDKETVEAVTLQTADEQVVEEATAEEVLDLNSLTAEQLVDYFSDVYGVDSTLAKAIIKCESGWDRTIKNPYSSASGYFQFINGTWSWTIKRMGLSMNTDKHDPVVSIQAGVWLLSQDGTGHWLESKSCWSQLI